MPEPAKSFIQALMEHILEQVRTPKVQVERAIGPILGLFIAEVLSAKLGSHFELISAEFPLLKTPPMRQSTNIDWLCYGTDLDQLLFVELKTTDTTFEREQAEIYLAAIRKIREIGSSFLVDDVRTIIPGSEERGKYKEILLRIQRDGRHTKCKNARLIYLAPEAMRDAKRETIDTEVEWLTFQDLPDQMPSSLYAEEWTVICKHLVELDRITRRSRNGASENDERRNFRGTCRFKELIRLCEDKQDAITVGFYGGLSKLGLANLDELQNRSHYKWDDTENETGPKDRSNWVSGREFLEIVGKARASAAHASND